MQSVTSNAVANVTKFEVLSSSNADWLLQESSNGYIIGYGWNKSTVTHSSFNAYSAYVPSGYRVAKVISGNAFADGQADAVTGAVHIGGSTNNRIAVYTQAGTFYAGNIRVVALLERT